MFISCDMKYNRLNKYLSVGGIVLPNYDLRCTKCNEEHNIRATMTEKSEKKIPCSKCGSFELETVFKSPPAYVKGSGTHKFPRRSSCGSDCPHAS